ncbi:paraslipin [Synechococcales cyanobacterium C]|uniref:Paraslipin n=1 Tax=Petrachloros mirabilis ULC683 TaxID=2781853 RepID=A0A8K1ZXY3_9CYAN|nr:SPFH domain-containing protein [Petrachloros mirabilis]NCJ06933.1 paraslipin [Petrachloros mirabilis ULC683]
MGYFWSFVILLFLGGAGVSSSVRVVQEANAALVERFGNYRRRLDPGLNFVFPGLDKVVYKDNLKIKVLDIAPQNCFTCDNVMITVDAVVYWQVINIEKAYYKVENLESAMVNLVQTQIRAEMGKLELDETFTARAQLSEILLQELDSATDPWGVKVTRVEIRDITPSKAVQDSMELQMSAERRKRAAILTSEGEREAAVNTARGVAEAQVLEAEAQQKAAILAAEGARQATVLGAQAEREQQVLRADATAKAIEIISNALNTDPKAIASLQFLLAQNYLDMGTEIGTSDSSKVMFMDPRSIPGTIEGMRSILDNPPTV